MADLITLQEQAESVHTRNCGLKSAPQPFEYNEMINIDSTPEMKTAFK